MKNSLILIILIFIIFSCSTSSDSANNISLPSLTTTIPSSITTTTISSGGTISSDGGAAVTARGVVWSTNPNPTIALATKTTDGTGTGVFTSTISGLTANTSYHIKSYATNSAGTAYGNELIFNTLQNSTSITVTDIDNNVYQTVTICNQIWTKTNLNVSRYRNGDVIPQVQDPTQWANLTTGAWCYYSNSTTNGTVYGRLYNWYAVNDPRGLAPTGYHIPSDTEWTTLTTCLGGEAVAGGLLKETGTTNWTTPNTDATNTSGFSGLPGGCRYLNSTSYIFIEINKYGYWWSSTVDGPTTGYPNAFYRRLNYNNVIVGRNSISKASGFSVRCLKD